MRQEGSRAARGRGRASRPELWNHTAWLSIYYHPRPLGGSKKEIHRKGLYDLHQRSTRVQNSGIYLLGHPGGLGEASSFCRFLYSKLTNLMKTLEGACNNYGHLVVKGMAITIEGLAITNSALTRFLDLAILLGHVDVAERLAKQCPGVPLRRWRSQDLFRVQDERHVERTIRVLQPQILAAALVAGLPLQSLCVPFRTPNHRHRKDQLAVEELNFNYHSWDMY